MRRLICLVTCIFCLLALGLSAYGRKRSIRSTNSFDYYLLVLSYAPDFCDEPGGNKDPRECGAGKKIGFVVHGLWPQSLAGRGPESCGGSPVSNSIVQLMLNYIPTPSLIQHEWTTHGTCTGLNASDYFALVRKARDAVTIPKDLAQPATDLSLSPSQIETDFAGANSSYAKGAFRTSCYNNAELQEARICLTKGLASMACPASLPDCTKPVLAIHHVR